jgi:enoyl-CoA hydratase
MTQPELIVERRGRAGRITLNRPQALNALTHSMILALTDALLAWRDDSSVELVAIDGAGGRAFCAGADIKALYRQGQGGERDRAEQFFRDEYRLNALIRSYGKPYVALIEGVTMGGGVGISVHGSHRVATERTLLAMPETGIGLFPDVGMTYVLPRLPDHTGLWLGLTGARLDGAAACALGLATHYAPSDMLPELIVALEADGVTALEAWASKPADPLAPRRAEIADAFGRDGLKTILAALDAGSEWAGEQAKTLRAMSPTSLAITYEALKRGGDAPFANCMRKELRMAARCLAGHDFYEGVRAQVVDKDRAPKWRPDSLEGVSKQDIDAYFAPLPEGRELEFINRNRV